MIRANLKDARQEAEDELLVDGGAKGGAEVTLQSEGVLFLGEGAEITEDALELFQQRGFQMRVQFGETDAVDGKRSRRISAAAADTAADDDASAVTATDDDDADESPEAKKLLKAALELNRPRVVAEGEDAAIERKILPLTPDENH